MAWPDSRSETVLLWYSPTPEGKAMELLLKPIVEESANRLGCNVLFQNKFKPVAP